MADEVTEEKIEPISYDLARLGKPFFFPVGIPLQIEIEGVALLMKSTSIGYFSDRYLVIRYPIAPISVSTMLSKGSKITVRYVHKGTIFAFRSELIAVTYETVNALFISYPLRIEQRDLRRARRIGCHLPCRIMRRNPDPTPETPLGDGVIVNISGGGCGLTGSDLNSEALARLGMRHDRSSIQIAGNGRRYSRCRRHKEGAEGRGKNRPRHQIP